MELAATIASAALSRVPLLALTHQKHQISGLYDLDDEPLERFLRPIFEESGSGERYERTSFVEQYGFVPPA